MFNDERVMLKAVNAVNKKGKLLDFNLEFPIKDENFIIPEDIVLLDLFEYHETNEGKYCKKLFKICVGKINTWEYFCINEPDKINVTDEVINSLGKGNNKVCYFDKSDGKHFIFTKVNPEDVVVNNTKELKEILIYISNNSKNTNESISNIKNISNDFEFVGEDNKIYKKIRK